MEKAKKQSNELSKKQDTIKQNSERILKSLLSGLLSFNDIERAAEKIIPNKKEREETLQIVRDKIEGVARLEPLVIRGFCVMAYQDIYAKSLAENDLATAIKAVERLNKLSTTGTDIIEDED
jgi:hypothetical protein